MYPPYPYPSYQMQPPSRGLTLDDIREARRQLKELEEDIKSGDKKDDKDKDKKKKPESPKFSFLETLSLLMLASIPVTLGQLWLLDYVKASLRAMH